MFYSLDSKLYGKYLVFDLDGTIIDTDEANYLSYKEAIKRVKNLDLDLIYFENKRFTREKLNLIIPNLTIKEFENIVKIKNEVFYKYLPYTKLNRTVLEIIKKFSKTNKIILATNSHKLRANSLLNYHNIFNLFDKKFFKEDYIDKDNKYLYIVKDLDINLNDILIFEDNNKEIYKAINLGISSKNIFNPNFALDFYKVVPMLCR